MHTPKLDQTRFGKSRAFNPINMAVPLANSLLPLSARWCLVWSTKSNSPLLRTNHRCEWYSRHPAVFAPRMTTAIIRFINFYFAARGRISFTYVSDTLANRLQAPITKQRLRLIISGIFLAVKPKPEQPKQLTKFGLQNFWTVHIFVINWHTITYCILNLLEVSWT